MISDSFYAYAFYISITFLIVVGILPLLKYKRLEDFPEINKWLGVVLLIIITVFFIGFRNPYGDWRYLGDTYNYTRKFLAISNNLEFNEKKDLGFYVYMRLMSGIGNVTFFYIVSAFLYIVPPYFTFRKWLGQNAYFALVIYISSMSFWGFAINGLRNGLATSFFIFALAFLNRKLIMAAIIVLAITFHKSIILPTAALILVQFFSNSLLLIKVWLFSIPVSFLFGRKIMSMLGTILSSSVSAIDKRSASVLSSEASEEVSAVTTSSFRIDFIVYSGAFVYLGYYFLHKLGYKSKLYTQLFQMYLITNTIWVFVIYAPFTNRTAYLSWFLIPIIISYPIVNMPNFENQSKFIGIAILGSLAFTWLLFYI